MEDKYIPSWLRQTTKEKELLEMSIAGWGDWQPKRDRVASKTLKSLKSDYKKLTDIEFDGISFELYKHKDKEWYLLGKINDLKLDDISFEVIFKIEFSKRPDITRMFSIYKNTVNVDGVMTREDMRGSKIGRFMYQYFVNKLDYTLLSDEIQYHKARLLWARLSKLDTVIVDIINLDKEVIVEKNITVHHGELDHEFDPRVWDYSDIKKNNLQSRK